MGCGASKIRENRTKWWVDELTDADGYFLDFEGWKGVIEGNRRHKWVVEDEEQEKEKEKGDSIFSDSVKKNVCALVTRKVHAKVMLGLHRAIGASLSMADEKLIEKGQPKIARILNCMAAVSLTYLYEDVDVDKFKHIRERSFDAVGDALEAPFLQAAQAAAAAAGVAAETGAAGSSAATAVASSAEAVTTQVVSVIEESKSVMEAHVSAILAAAVVKGGEMGAGSDASSEADLALQLFATLQGKTSVEVDLMVESSKGCIHRLVEIGVKLGGMSAAASGKQVQIREDAEYRKLRATLEEELTRFEAKLFMASYGAVSKAVYGMAQLHAPESEAEIGQEAERGVGNKRRGVPKRLQELRAKRKAKVEERWMKEVWSGERFKGYQGWEDQYGEKKDGKAAAETGGSSSEAAGGAEPREGQEMGEGGGGAAASGEGAGGDAAVTDDELAKEEEAARAEREVEDKAMADDFIKRVESADLAGKLAESSVKVVTEAACTALNGADSRLRQIQPRSLGHCVNYLAAILYTFHFEPQSKRRFQAIRGEAVSMLFQALVTALTALQILADTTTPQPNPTKEQLDALCSSVSSKVMDKVVESAKDAATTLIPSSAPGLDSQRVLHVEKGFEVGGRLVATAQDVLATGMERGAAKLQPYVSDMFVIAWEARDAILSQAKVKSGAEGIPAQGYEEVCAKLEGKIGELRAAVVGWVDDITRRVVSKGLDIAKGQVALKDAAV